MRKLVAPTSMLRVPSRHRTVQLAICVGVIGCASVPTPSTQPPRPEVWIVPTGGSNQRLAYESAPLLWREFLIASQDSQPRLLSIRLTARRRAVNLITTAGSGPERRSRADLDSASTLILCQHRGEPVLLRLRRDSGDAGSPTFHLSVKAEQRNRSLRSDVRVDESVVSIPFDECSIDPTAGEATETVELHHEGPAWLVVWSNQLLRSQWRLGDGRVSVIRYDDSASVALFTVARGNVPLTVRVPAGRAMRSGRVLARALPIDAMPTSVSWTRSPIVATGRAGGMALAAYRMDVGRWRNSRLSLLVTGATGEVSLLRADGSVIQQLPVTGSDSLHIEAPNASGEVLLAFQLRIDSARTTAAEIGARWGRRAIATPIAVATRRDPPADRKVPRSVVRMGKSTEEVRFSLQPRQAPTIELLIPSAGGSLVVFASPLIEFAMVAGITTQTIPSPIRTPLPDGRMSTTFSLSRSGRFRLRVWSRSPRLVEAALRLRWIESPS